MKNKKKIKNCREAIYNVLASSKKPLTTYKVWEKVTKFYYVSYKSVINRLGEMYNSLDVNKSKTSGSHYKSWEM